MLLLTTLPCRASAAMYHNSGIVDRTSVPRFQANEQKQAWAPACDVQSAKACQPPGLSASAERHPSQALYDGVKESSGSAHRHS